jgi:hypothetical protein
MRGVVMTVRVTVPVAALALVILAASTAQATHAPDHRFLVLGYVADGEGHPAAGVRVVVTRLRTGYEYPTATERDGFYLVILHLHDEDEGERLQIDVNGVTGEVRARFDTQDKKAERGTRVDVKGDRLVETKSAFAETLRDYLSR